MDTDPEVDFADVNPFSTFKSVVTPKSDNSNQSNDEITNFFDPNELYYNMSGEKYLLIFNHMKFQKTVHFRNERPSERTGTEADVVSLKKVFQKMDYKVLVYNDFVYDDIMKTIKNISQQDHRTTACLCVVILTHGDKDEYVFAADMPYNLRDITVKLENGHASLVGKPKLFFIQACRGNNLDAGRRVQTDGAGSSMTIPSTADFLFLRSSVEGYLSFRNANGSFLMQELCKMLEKHYDQDIHYITTAVNWAVASEYSTYTPAEKKTHNKKQMPEVRHTLTKLFKF